MASMDTRAIEHEIDRIRSLGLEELRREWRRLNHGEPPRISRDLGVLLPILRESGCNHSASSSVRGVAFVLGPVASEVITSPIQNFASITD
jgi:hypothetical protein